MGHYRFDLIDRTGAILQSQFYSCADDLDALDKAERLCARNEVDVWDGARRVLHLKRENAMATPIATGALRPRVAVGIAAILNLVGAFISTTVATTISGGLINEGKGGVLITPTLIFAGLLGAIVWNLVTWVLGLPSSSRRAACRPAVP